MLHNFVHEDETIQLNHMFENLEESYISLLIKQTLIDCNYGRECEIWQ